MPAAFGKDCYYSQPSATDFSSSTEATDFFQEVLSDGEGLEDQVHTASDRWKNRTRQKINSATKLNLTYDDRQESIPVRVTGKLPPPFAKLYEEHPNPLVWKLLLQRAKLETTEEGIRLIGNNIDDLKSIFDSLSDAGASERDFGVVLSFIESLFRELGDTERGDGPILKSFQNISVDVLGAYHFRVPIIHLYWIPIVLLAKILDVRIASLTAVVQLHERAHAYTHRGFDADGNQWPTDAFAKADLPLVEGLAQYYTWAVCSSLEDQYPSLLETFRKLSNLQSTVYEAHREWNPEGERAGEVIRGAMIAARARAMTDFGEFGLAVEEVRAQQQENEENPYAWL